MSWEAIGAFAELLGALAVIISIIYLAAQVRNGASDVRSNIIHALHSNEVELMSKPATDAVLASAMEKAHTNGTLSDEERAQYSMYVYAIIVNFQQIHAEYVRLGVDSDVSSAMRRRLVGLFYSSLAIAVWNRLKDRFTEQFQVYVNDCIEEAVEKSQNPK